MKAIPELPMKTEPWTFSLPTNTDWTPEFSKATRISAGQYRSGDKEIDVHIISYAAKSKDSELINSLNRLFDPERWRQVEKRAGTVTLSAGHSLPYIALSIRSRTDQKRSRIVWYWYLADGRPAVNPFFVKLLETINLFTAETNTSSLVALSTSADDDAAAAQSIFEEFLARFCGDAIAGTVPAQTPVCGH
jgi:EpsI family protein